MNETHVIDDFERMALEPPSGIDSNIKDQEEKHVCVKNTMNLCSRINLIGKLIQLINIITFSQLIQWKQVLKNAL